jgi:tetratricopeptide (TPR) repeat protein
MAGNRKLYEQAMNMGHSAAWDQEWDKAIAAYGRAVQEFPEDPAAHNSLGLALLQARRLEDALRVYTRAHQLAQDDPIPLEKSADVLERLGRLNEAAQQYINVADIYLAQHDIEKAIGNWERATRLTSGLVQIHQRLAVAYERTGQRKSAIREYLTLAFNFQKANRSDIARQAVERALRIDPRNPQALNTLAAIERDVPIEQSVIEPDEPKHEPKREQMFTLAQIGGLPSEYPPRDQEPDEEAQKPDTIGTAVEHALETLATYVFETGMQEPGSQDAIRAIDYQRQEAYEEATAAYERAVMAGLQHATVYLNLGWLYIQNGAWQNAIEALTHVYDDPELGGGAMHGLGQAYMALDDQHETAVTLVRALRRIDNELSPDDDGLALNAIYNRLESDIETSDAHQLRAINERFLDLLGGPLWFQHVPETRRQLEEIIRTQNPETLVPIIPYIDYHITKGLNLIDRYLREGLFVLAMDQCHYMLESAPDYLPIHWRIGRILLERDNIQSAISKFNMVAKTYLIRGDRDRAAQILQDSIKVAPMDISLHQSLIELLENEEDWDGVLDQYVNLADAYYQLADMESARNTYQSAIQLARRVEAPQAKIVHILHRIGDIDVSRLDLRQAMRTYEEIRRLDPEDERARRSLVDINYRLGDQVSAVRELDGLLRLYAKQHRADRIIQVLEEQVTRYNKDMALRSRLAAVYRQTGRNDKAVEHLDALAELQLEAGMHNDALVTIQRIVALNPPHADDYRRLLHQLSGGGA